MTTKTAAGSRENGRVLAAEALKQALGTVLDYASKGGHIVTWDAAAEAILDAMPEGWELVHWPEEQEKLRLLVDSYERKGAQQERERLRAIDPFGGTGWGTPPYPIPRHLTVTVRGGTPLELLLDFQSWLLADPEATDE